MTRISWRLSLSSVEWEFTILICELWSVHLVLDVGANNLTVSFSVRRYEKAVVAMAKQSVTLELLSYHASASLEDALRLKVSVEYGASEYICCIRH